LFCYWAATDNLCMTKDRPVFAALPGRADARSQMEGNLKLALEPGDGSCRQWAAAGPMRRS
jgi:hypothetical protein